MLEMFTELLPDTTMEMSTEPLPADSMLEIVFDEPPEELVTMVIPSPAELCGAKKSPLSLHPCKFAVIESSTLVTAMT